MPTDRTPPSRDGRATAPMGVTPTPHGTRRRASAATLTTQRPGVRALPAVASWSTWGWIRHWEFWLVLLVGVPIRLWNLGFSEMVGDQINYLTLARESLQRGAFPVTGLQFTIGIRSSPLDILLTIPFVLGGKNPLPDVIFIAFFSILGLVFCYIFAEREFGRLVAIVATLLLAVCGYAFDYSRFLWQLSYDPALLVFWGMSLYAGAIRGSRNWLVANIALLGIMVSLHPTALALLPVTLIALALAPQAPPRRAYLWAAAMVVLLALPTAVWEVVSHGYDLTRLLMYSSGHPVINLDVFRMLYNLLGPPTTPYANFSVAYAATTPDAPYAWLNPISPWIRRGVNVVYPVSYLVLTALVLAPAAAPLWARRSIEPWWRGARALPGTVWHGLRASARWRALLILWLWVTLPPLSMLRHSSAVHDHYLLVMYPAVFIMVGIAVEWTVTQLIPTFATGLGQRLGDSRARAVSALGTITLYAVLGFFIAGQWAQCVLYLASVQQGKITTVGFYHPLGEMQSADARLRQLQRERVATAVYLVNPFEEYPSSITYLLVRDEPQRMSFAGACLLLPAPQAGPALVVSTSSITPAATLLPALPNATHVEDISMPGGEPFQVYAVQGNLPLLPREHAVGPITFADAAGNGLRLDAEATVAPGVLRLRWTVLTSTPAHQLPAFFAMRAWAVSADNTAQSMLAQSDCEPTRWEAGQTLFTWLTAPTKPPEPGKRPPPPPAWSADAIVLDVTDHTTDFWMSSVGPIHLLSGVRIDSPSRSMTPAPAATSGAPVAPTSITPDGRLILSLTSG
jgi:hypothetical protein